MTKPNRPSMNHLLTMESLDEATITFILNRAEDLLASSVKSGQMLDTLHGQVAVNLFFEPSTRTRNSFEIAQKRLGAIVLSPDMQQSATAKGELLIDTLHNLESMGANLLIVRHPDNNLAQFLASELSSGVSVINAGDGSNEHPTQALVDLLTIRQHRNDFASRSVAIIGDVMHSRVARSLIIGLRTMGVKRIRIIAPDYFMPEESDTMQADMMNSMSAGLKDIDIIYTLRIQKERMDSTQYPNEGEYFNTFGLTQEKLALAKPDAIVMHSGPINRGIEIESVVADGPQSVILQQTQNSVAIRMAVIETLLNNH